MSKVHIWIGTTTADEETFNAYFDQEEEMSRFSQDIGLDEEYDEDFIGILPIMDREYPVAEIIANKIPISIESLTYAVASCDRYGMESANAAFYLTDSKVEIEKPIRDHYNELKYLGVFESAL
ncbi:immunity 22 family protein [Pedobacter sp. GSP4]|uniref:immunity 22 family protein n=1 Tax=Pedobacter sp. GSP4 TaxID=3453716 RepID=UPI003EE89671